MNLYNRDYTQLSKDEYTQWLSFLEKEQGDGNSEHERFSIRKPIKYPKVLRHYKSLFPNNYLDNTELSESSKLKKQLDGFRTLLNSSDTGEREIINFIKKKQAYFIIASILKRYFDFGHHGAYLFPEFQLGTSYKVAIF